MSAPLRVQILSDLHRDVRPAGVALAPGADVLVVAGDICQAIPESLAYLREAVPAPTPIVFVSGNHEHYGHAIGEGLEQAPALAMDLGVHFLENASAIVSGVRFLGCTLWTDYGIAGDHWRDQAMLHARDGMNDHRKIALTKKPWVRFLPQHALAIHLASREWLKRALSEPFDGPTVVVTHHAPSMRSVHARYKGDIINAAFASDLDDLVASSGAVLWAHGHTHSSFDYRIGRTRVLCNPHGYGNENPDFDPALIVEIPRP